MEKLIKTFTRVIQQIDDAEYLIKSFPELKAAAYSDPPSLTSQDRRRLLDFPEPETQAANIAEASSLSKSELLRRAAESPSELTTSEVELLEKRFWLSLSSDELKARTAANTAWQAVSPDHRREVARELRDIRASLYEENEAKAIENAECETSRRLIERASALLQPQSERVPARAPLWVKRLWTEDEGKKPWGYAVFVDPDVDEDERIDDYEARRDGVLFHARGAICCGDTISARWRLHRLAWPPEAIGSNDEDVYDTGDATESAATQDRLVKFHELRKRFISIKDSPQKKRRTMAGGSLVETGGPPDGILRNVFLVIDKESFDSVLSKSGNVDDMWVWAVDVDYDPQTDFQEAQLPRHAPAQANSEHAGAEEDSGDNQAPQTSPTAHALAMVADGDNKYQGYFRVRLQQLVHNFFDLRRFHEEEYPMERLWQAAKRSKDGVFASVREEGIGLWTMNRTHGTALRTIH